MFITLILFILLILFNNFKNIQINSSIIISIISLIIAIITVIVNKRATDVTKIMEKRDLKRYTQEVDSKARNFITKYNYKNNEYSIPEITKLDLCIIAYMFNPIYNYKNQLYIDFNILNDDVKKKVLEIRKSKINFDNISTIQNFYNTLYNQLLIIIVDKYPMLFTIIVNNNEYNLLNTYLEKGLIGSSCYPVDIYELNYYTNIVNNAFIDNNFTMIIDIFNKKELPINLLRYLLCIITQNIIKYSINDVNQSIFNNICTLEKLNYDNGIVTYEDVFLHTLLIWYVGIDIIKNKKE